MRDIISNLVTSAKNDLFLEIHSTNLIKFTIFGIDKNNAHGLDDFGRVFDRFYWYIIGNDLVFAVQDFFHSGYIAEYINSNFIVLIWKVKDVIFVEQYHSIMSGNFILNYYKDSC